MTRLIEHGDPPRYLTFPSLGALGVPHVTTTRHFNGAMGFGERAGPFGDDAARILHPAGVDPARVAYARQVHGADVVRVQEPGFVGTADVLVTTERALPLAIFTADCLAVTLVDRLACALVVAHVGWRGTVGGATLAAVTALEDAGGQARLARVTIGPSIGPCCYEVDEPVLTALGQAYGAAAESWLTPARPGRWMLDLWRANEELLERAGISGERIENARLCTACHPGFLCSYRRGVPGRLVTIAALP